VRTAAQGWRSDLIDVSGGNRLLFFRDLKVGMLDVSHVRPEVLTALTSQEVVRLATLTGNDLDGAVASKSLKAIYGRAKVAAEEYGLQLPYLAVGFATWDPPGGEGPGDQEQGARPVGRTNAPVLLWPMEIIPKPGQAGTFDLRATGEARLNPVLLHFLGATFDVSVDDSSVLEESVAPARVFERLTGELVGRVPGFVIEQRSLIANFFYTDQSMVEDLDPSNSEFLAESEAIAALAGDENATDSLVGAGSEIDAGMPDRLPPSAEFLVLDADSSQTYVVNAVLAGQNLVVQGPPGTGKSQTIANVIAALAAQGKTALFVAQKRAAIDAVLKRLRSVGLADLALDLFEAEKSRKMTVESIARSLHDARTTAEPDTTQLFRELEATRHRLIDHDEAVNEIRAPWGMPLLVGPGGGTELGLVDIALRGECVATTRARIRFDQLFAWESGTFAELRGMLREVAARGATAGDYTTRMGWTSSPTLTLEQVAASTEKLAAVRDQLPTLRAHLSAVEDRIGSRLPTGVALPWVDQLGAAFASIESLVQSGAVVLLADDISIQQLCTFGYATGDRAYRRNDTSLKLGWLERRRSAQQVALMVDGLGRREVHRLVVMAKDLRENWEGLWPGAKCPAEVVDSRALVAVVRTLLENLEGAQPSVQACDLVALDLDGLADLVAVLCVERERLGRPEANRLRQRLVNDGLQPLLDDLRATDTHDPEGAAARLDALFARSVIEHLEQTDPRLAGITGRELDRCAVEFGTHDAEARRANAERVRRAVAVRLADIRESHRAQNEVIAEQVRRKRGFKPVRELLALAPDVMLAAKPIWALSPQLASQVLPRRAMFDVVIFDEASQVQLPAALPAIARGTQLVVVGDSRQLPPDLTFQRRLLGVAVDGHELTEDEEVAGDGTGIVVRDVESVLDAIEIKLGVQRSRHLSWHYRSRDEALIATSNQYVYRPIGRLMTTFPGAAAAHALRHDVVPFSKGTSPNNLSPAEEVKHVADLVVDHAHTQSGDTLGVIAFGVAHSNRIEAELERRSRSDPQLAAFIGADGDEPFFVKKPGTRPGRRAHRHHSERWICKRRRWTTPLLLGADQQQRRRTAHQRGD
jgi:hypothetical protein